MKNGISIMVAKVLAFIGFLALIVCTYFLRSEVLSLSHIIFSADSVRANYELKQLRDSYPERLKQFEAETKNHELQTVHYRKMLDLYQNNYDAYAKQIKDKDYLPRVPDVPIKPTPPEIAEKLHEIDTDFRVRKDQYFETASQLNWAACVAALMLVGGLVYLMMFDENCHRWHYLVALSISFIFLIGPAFHSIITGIIGILQGPASL